MADLKALLDLKAHTEKRDQLVKQDHKDHRAQKVQWDVEDQEEKKEMLV